MKTTKIVSLAFQNMTVQNVEVVINRELGPVKKPTIAILGGNLEIPKRINRSLLKAMCTTLGEKLGKKKFNIVTTGCSGIPSWVSRAASKNGATVVTISELSRKQENKDDCSDMAIYTNFDHEFVSFLISYVADIGISIDGGIGSLIKGSIMVDYEKPLICMKNTGGVASKIPDLLRESVHNFQDIDLYEVETVNELMRVLSGLTEGKILLQSKLQKILNQIQ